MIRARRGWPASALRTSIIAVLVLIAPTARAGDRVAIVIGSNAGDRSEVTLRYAEDDAGRVATALRAGGFAPQDVVVVRGGSAADVRRAVTGLHARYRLVVVYYSGHGDAESVHLAGTRLAISELRELVEAVPASARVLVVDACRSGALTRVKGGAQGPAFAIQVAAHAPEGMAILTSSAAGEDAQESDALGASFFTHHFVSGLLGAADRDRDGEVSIDEVFEYAAERTVAATVATMPGPQHPTYRIDLAGRGHVVLTRPGASGGGMIAFAEPGSWLVQRATGTALGGRGDGAVVGEVTSEEPGRRIAIEAGRYVVTRRAADHLVQGTIVVAAGLTTQVSASGLRRFDYARIVRKGGTERRTAISAFAGGGTGGALLALGRPLLLRGGARLDTPVLAYEVRVTAGASEAANPRHTTRTRELAVALAALKVFDLGRLGVGAGLLVGGGGLAQHFVAPDREPDGIPAEPDRTSGFGVFAPLVTCDVQATRRLYLRAELSAPTYVVRAASGVTTRLSWDLGAALGMFF